MRLRLIGHDYRYAAEQALLSFFPDERPEYVQERPEGAVGGGECPREDNWADIKLSKGPQYHTVTVKLSYRGRLASALARGRAEGLDPRQSGRLGRRLVRLSLYKAAVSVLGEGLPWGALTGVRPAKLVTAYLESGLRPQSAKKRLMKDFFVSEPRAELCLSAAQTALRAKSTLKPSEVSLYVGIPFCPTRCAYCSFVSSAVGSSGRYIEPYLEALRLEIQALGRRLGELGLKIKTIYIGGGTPTTLSAAQLQRLLSEIEKSADTDRLLEYTVEAGRPDTIDLEKLSVLRDFGVDRVSINPQSMVQGVLDAAGRLHSPGQVLEAVELVRRLGFKSLNMDLIAGLPADSVSGFDYSLNEVLKLRPENITIHTLALKRGSDIKLRGGERPSGDQVFKMLELGYGKLFEFGYLPYYVYRQKYTTGGFENTGFTLGGFDCLYNVYMMEELQTIVSAGCGGSTKLVGAQGLTRREFNPKYPKEYIEGIEGVLEKKRSLNLS